MAERRGQGRGSAYVPWLFIHDFPSQGTVSRVRSPITGRIHHLLSTLECSWFYVLHAIHGLLDYREQFPLRPLEETQEIAREVGVVHPTNPKTREPEMMSSDIVLTIGEGLRKTQVVRTVKPSAELNSVRVLQKVEIERRYWAQRKIAWGILTERELPQGLLKNMRWLFLCLDISGVIGLTQVDIARPSTPATHSVQARHPGLRAYVGVLPSGHGVTPFSMVVFTTGEMPSSQLRGQGLADADAGVQRLLGLRQFAD